MFRVNVGMFPSRECWNVSRVVVMFPSFFSPLLENCLSDNVPSGLHQAVGVYVSQHPIEPILKAFTDHPDLSNFFSFFPVDIFPGLCFFFSEYYKFFYILSELQLFLPVAIPFHGFFLPIIYVIIALLTARWDIFARFCNLFAQISLSPAVWSLIGQQ